MHLQIKIPRTIESGDITEDELKPALKMVPQSMNHEITQEDIERNEATTTLADLDGSDRLDLGEFTIRYHFP